MPPETSTATNLYRRTLTPRVSAATGDSPTERSRRPKAVRQSTHAVTPNRATASRVSTETSVTKPRRIPARSEMKKMCCCSRFPRASEMTGSETVGSSGSGGDCVGPPPGMGEKKRAARYLAVPAPMMFRATPETMWSTPKITVATAWIRPPTTPATIAPRMPTHGPQ